MQSWSLDRRRELPFRLFLITLFAIAVLPRMANAATKVATDADKGNDIQVKVGDVLEVRLNANPSTGYKWSVHPKSTALLRLSGETQTPGPEPAADRPMVQVFTFEVKKKGDGILLMRYAPAKEKPQLGEEQYSLHVIIDP
ncbi:MAG: protease inhibitor I42 family protein [Terracidiphilus sp.]|jgi:inhibitor of cysteine peptidase